MSPTEAQGNSKVIIRENSVDYSTKKKNVRSKASSKMVNSRRPIVIMTHMNVDADAAFSTALLHVIRPHAAIVFAPADSEPSDGGTIAVDRMNGPRPSRDFNTECFRPYR